MILEITVHIEKKLTEEEVEAIQNANTVEVLQSMKSGTKKMLRSEGIEESDIKELEVRLLD